MGVSNRHALMNSDTCEIYNNTQNINVNSSGLNRESRAKVLDVVNQILNGVKQGDIIDAEIKEKDS